MPRDGGVQSGGRSSRPCPAPSLRRTYRLTVVCHAADCDGIEAELRTLLDEYALALQSLCCDQTSYVFVRVTALVASSIAERAGLVKIVNRLGTDPKIRRLQWESVPAA
jgi:hypothetical protein